MKIRGARGEQDEQMRKNARLSPIVSQYTTMLSKMDVAGQGCFEHKNCSDEYNGQTTYAISSFYANLTTQVL